MAKINVRDRNRNKLDKKPNWEYRFEAAKIDGKRKHISQSGFRTKKEALEAGATALATYNSLGTYYEPSEIGVCDYLDLWFKEYCLMNLQPKTIGLYSYIISKHIKPYFHQYKLKQITATNIQTYINHIAKKGYSRSTTAMIFSVIRSAIKYAIIPLNYIKGDPLSGVSLPRHMPYPKKREIISLETFNTILNLFHDKRELQILLLLGWYCGLRISEAFALTWDDIDFDAKTISINKQLAVYPKTLRVTNAYSRICVSPPKYNSVRTIKIGDSLINILQAELRRQKANEHEYGEYYTTYYLQEVIDSNGNRVKFLNQTFKRDLQHSMFDFVCRFENGRYLSQFQSCRINKLVKKNIGIDFDYHSLRHTHATLLIEKGVSPVAVQQRLGHKELSTTLSIYVDVTDAMKVDAVDKIDDVIIEPFI